MKYFLHDTDSFDDEKISELFIRFGYEGLGLFYTILEKIAKQEKPIKTDVLKSQLKVGKRLNKCWNFMESLGIICSKNGQTFNEQLLNYSEKYQIKKEKNRKKIIEWREKQDDTNNVTSYEPVRNPRKVNKSKVNKSKVNINKEKDMSEITYPWTEKEFFDVWEFWKKYQREQFRFAYKPIGELGAVNNLYKLSGGDLSVAMMIIKQSIQNGWKGLFELKGQFKNQEYDREKIFADLQQI